MAFPLRTWVEESRDFLRMRWKAPFVEILPSANEGCNHCERTIWILPGMERFRHGGHFCHGLNLSFLPLKMCGDLELHWITFSKEVDKDYDKEAFGQYFHILRRGSLAVSMVTRYWYECRAVRKIIRKLNPDLVHAWGSEDVWDCRFEIGNKNKLFTLQGSLTDYFQKMGGSFLFRTQASYEEGTVKKFKEEPQKVQWPLDCSRSSILQ